MKNYVEVMFFRKDIYEMFFNNDSYIVPNAYMINRIGDDTMIFIDEVIDNDSNSSRFNILSHIKNVIVANNFIENKKMFITHDNEAKPVRLFADIPRIEGCDICVVISTGSIND